MSTRKKTANKCESCGKRWEDHLGLVGTCEKLERARSALKIISIWARFHRGECLTPEDTADLCAKVLKETA